MSFSKIRVAVLRGGSSSEYDTSLKTGAEVLLHLRAMPDLYEPIDIFISKEGEWHLKGLVHAPHQALSQADVVWNALHGSYGAGGQVQRLLEESQVPFTGSSAVSSALATNKDMAKNLYEKNALLTPSYELIIKDDWSEERLINIFRNYLLPIVVKPARSPNTLSISGNETSRVVLAHTFDDLRQSIKNTFTHSPRVLVEEFVRGDEVVCTVIEDARGEKMYALLPAIDQNKMQNKKAQSIDQVRVKYHPFRLGGLGKKVEDLAKQAHKVLGLSHYSSSKFIITPKEKMYLISTNSLPELHQNSLMHYSLNATGWHPRNFVDHILKLAM